MKNSFKNCISLRNKFIIISIVFLLILLIVSYIFGKLVYNSSVGLEQLIKNEDIVKIFSERKDKPLEKLKNYKTSELMIQSSNNYKLESLFITSNIKTRDTMILVHGIGSSYYEMLKVAYRYLDKGYNVLVYNQRNTVNSGGDNYTFGLYERYDLDTLVKFVKNKFPEGRLGVHGFSMGAGTAAMHSEINSKDDKVDFYILDSPYSEMKDAIRMGVLEKRIPDILINYVVTCGDLYNKFKSGFWYSDVKPYESVEKSNVPILFIHGTKDTVCNYQNSKKMYDLVKHDKKDLWLIEGIGHVDGFEHDSTVYFNKIFKFIDSNVLSDKS
ncbi:alpha/beta hydrolase [Clostridioides difficile]|nr:alpha/beta hydrolase [Clostridioides difficile]